MKKIIFLSLFTSALYSQTTIYSGNGTLSANRTVTMNAKNLTFNPSTANSQFFINGTSGKIGINTITPLGFLDINNNSINGATYTDGIDAFNKNMLINAGYTINGMGQKTFKFSDMPASNISALPVIHLAIEDRADFNRLRFYAYQGGGSSFGLYNKLQEEIYRVEEDGNNKTTLTLPKADSYLGIGTTSFIDGSDVYRLSVKGAIRAHEVKVYTTWADYVFKEDYKLPSLKEVEDYIKLNGHLINVPSAAQVEKEGIKVGEMTKIQQEKIEELTLYIIQQNKDIEELKNQVKALIEKVK
ncbi:MAG: hypothetical protein A3G95_06460 [Flavobacteria bacterium RIFCSPLOWO2_12_FULL_31_7]|nr:MAG: hypothetical protein A3G95_06460 [Flavobacteria bacterium RIFCSPLOWO2_12_FULL_31_7]